MRVRLLGPLVVEDETGTVVAVPGARERAILSLLAARANVAIPTDLLIEELWGADPPRTARKSLHAYVSRLRAALGALPGVSVDTISDAYRLSISPDRVDIHEFERLTDVGHASFAAGAYATAHATLGRALALWCGRPLQDLARVPEDLVARLERLRRQAVEERITAGLHCGRERSAIEEARTALAEDPYRETLWNALMVALYRVGLQAEAVAAFDDARRVLLDGLGLEPGVGLQRTLDQILQQDEGLAVPPARHGPLHSDLEFASTQPLFGRERSVEIVEGWFPSAGLQIGLIGGPPGIGKTRLAAELAARLRRRGVAVLYGSHEPGNSDPLRALVRASEVIDEPVDANAIDRLFVEDGLLLILDDLGSLTADLARWAESVRAVQAPVLLLLLHSGAVVETDFEAPVAGIALDPLPFAAIEAITRQHLGGLIAPGDSREIHLRSSGNPGVAHQAAQELATERAHHSLALATDAVEEGRRVLDSHHHLMDAALSRLQRTADAAPIARSRAPYRGLARYEMEDAGLFFGREELTRQLIIRVVENRLVAVVGASGSGKSSLVRAGLGAAATSGLLPGGSWRVEIATAGSPSDVQPFFEHAPPSRRLVIIDQFEQIFGPQWTAGDRTVVYEMLRTSTSENTRIVLVIRSDYYGSVSESAEVARMVSEATVIVGPMQSTELRRAIELPAATRGVRLDPDLSLELVSDGLRHPSALPLLSTALLELWEHRRGGVMTLADYDASGGLSRAISRLAEETYVTLSPAGQAAARTVFVRLAGPGDGSGVMGRPISRTDLAPDLLPVVDVLVRDRLLTSDDDRIGVAHEALFREWPRLAGWLEEEKAGRELHSNLTHATTAWLRSGEQDDDLYTGARLTAALEWAADPLPLSPDEARFLRRSQEFAEREQARNLERAETAEAMNRQLRRRARSLAVLVVVAMILGLAAEGLRRDALDESRRALAASLASQALGHENLDVALLLAVEARRLSDDAVTRGALLGTLLRSPAAVRVFRSPSDRFVSVRVSPDGRLMAALSTDGRIDLWATDGFQHIASMQAPDWGPGASLAFSADSSLLISTEESGGGRGSVRWWDVDTARQVRSRLVPTFAPLVAFWDTELVALDVTGALHHFDVASGELVRTEDDVVPVNEGGINLAVSRDGSTLVISSAVETVIRTSTGESRLELNGWATPSQDGTLIAVANLDGEVTLVRTGDGTTVAELRGHTAAIESVEFSPTGTDLITTSADSTAIRWDLAAARPTEVLRGHSGRVTGVAVAPDGVSAFTSGLDGTVIGWDLSGAFRLDRRLWSVEPPVWGAIAVGGTRRMLLLGPERARLVDTASGTVVGSVPGEWWTGSTLPDDPKVALGGRDVVVFDTNTGDVTRIPSPFGSDGVGWLALSPDGTLAVTSPSGLVVLTPEASPRWLNASRSWGVDYNDSGTLLAAGRQDGSVAIWDTATWTLRSTIPPVGQRDPILGLRFSPEGQLVTHNLEGPIRVWNVDHGTQTSDALSAHSGFVGHVDFSPTQPLMLSVGSDGRIGLWDTETWSLYGGLLSGPAATPGWAWFTQDGAIIAVFEDGSARRWSVEADEWERRACAIAGRSLTIEEWTEFAPDWPQPDATC